MEDYTDHVPGPTQKEFAQLAEAVHRLSNQQAKAAALEGELRAAKILQDDIAEREIPEIMESLGLSEFTTTSGLQISLRQTVHAHIKAENFSRAMDWLERNGHGGLIKHRLEIALGRDSERVKDQLYARIQELGVNIADNPKVEPSTLRAFCKELLETGKPLDQELFGVFVRKSAKIT